MNRKVVETKFLVNGAELIGEMETAYAHLSDWAKAPQHSYSVGDDLKFSVTARPDGLFELVISSEWDIDDPNGKEAYAGHLESQRCLDEENSKLVASCAKAVS
jgi:hypothetical protein